MSVSGPKSRGSRAPEPRRQLPQRLGRLGTRLIDSTKLTPEQVATLRKRRELPLVCASCGAPVSLGAGTSPSFFHRTGHGLCHDPITPTHEASLSALRARLSEILPSAMLDRDVDFPEVGYMADLAAVSGRGLRLAAEVQENEITRARFEEITSGLEAEGIAILWMRMPSLLKLSGAKSRPVRKVTLGEMETAILAQGRALMYLAPDQMGERASGDRHPKILLVHVPRYAVELARLGEPRVGQVEAVLRRYPLSQLRLRAGSVCVLTDFDPPLPAFSPPSERLAGKLRARGAQGRIAV